MYEYRATVVGVVDGDTVDLDVDLGFHTQFNSRFRLFGINTPESYGKEASVAGHAAKDRLKALLPVGLVVLVRTEKDKTEKYGRFLGTIQLRDGPLAGKSVNDILVKEGHALAYFGKGVKPV
mgnify:CR=1 FL=1